MKISLKISLLVAVLAFGMSFIVGKYANDVSTGELEKKSGQNLVNLSKNIADILDREMLERYREIEFASTLNPIIDKNSSVLEIREYIEKLKGKHNHHEWIGFALPDGTVKAGTNGYLEGKNASARPWLPGGLKGAYIGDVHDALLLAKLLPNISGEEIYFTDVAFPVKSKDNELLGVLCTHLTWQWTRDVIRSIQKENGVDIFLLSKDGLVLVGPDKTERKEIKDISSNVANSFTNDTTYKVLDWKMGKKYLTAHTISKGFDEYEGFGWKVIVRQNLDDAYKSARENSNTILYMSIFAGLLGGIIGIILTNLFIKPLKSLSNKVEEFSKGNDVEFNKFKSNDEIGNLERVIEELYEGLNKESKLKRIAEDKVGISLRVFDQSLEGIMITNKDNKTILVNKAFTNITGYSQEDIYLKNPSILSSGKQDKKFYDDLWKELVENGKWEGKIENKRKNGTIYSENLRITTLKDEHGNIVNYLATFDSGFR